MNDRERHWLVSSVVYPLLVSGLVALALRVVNLAVPYPLVAAICLAVGLTREAVRLVREPPAVRTADLVRPVEVQRRNQPGSWYEGGDGMVVAMRRWNRLMEWGDVAGGRFAHTVGRQIGELVDERLRQRHGVTRASDPERARELLGERLWALLEPAATRPPSPRQILAALDDLERRERLAQGESLEHGERKDEG